MPNPLKLRTHANGVYNDGVQVTTNAELDYLVKKLLVKYATESGSGDSTGDLNIDSSGTSVGTFDDNFATAETGTHPYVGSTSTTTYTFKQNNSSTSESSIHPLITIDSPSNNGHVRIVNDTELNAVMDLALSDIAKSNATAAGTGTYFVGESAPSITGTWVAQDQFFDEITNHANDDASKTTYKLWRKTSYDNSPAEVKLLKQVLGNIKVQTDAELEHLTTRLRNRIIATGIGTYKFQTSSPSPGTWVARGSAIDRNPTISSLQYTGTFSANYSRQFSRQFDRSFSDQYTRGQFARQFTSQFTRIFSANYSVSFARAFSRSFARNIIGSQYTRGQFTRIFSGQYTRQFARIFTGQYTRQFDRSFSGQYDRLYSNQFTRQTDGPIYSQTYAGTYTRDSQYARAFGRTYSGNYGVSYTRVQYSRIFSANYQRIYSGQYARTFSAQYTGTFARQFTAQYETQFSREVNPSMFGYSADGGGAGGISAYSAGNYDSNPPYYGPPTVIKPAPQDNPQYNRGSFFRSANVYDSGAGGGLGGNGGNRGYSRLQAYFRQMTDFQGNPVIFAGQFARITAGPGYDSQFARATGGPQYTRSTPGPSYARTTPGPQYAGTQYTVNYARLVTGPNYTGTQYASTYSGSRSYGSYVRQFDGPQYTGNFARAQYSRATPGSQFSGPQYARITPGPSYDGPQYTRTTPGPQYTGQFTNNFSGDYSVSFASGDTYAINFARIVVGPQYAGQFTRAQFTGQYTRVTPGPAYSDGQYSSNFAGSRQRQFAGDTVTSNFSTTTKTLWLRVA